MLITKESSPPKKNQFRIRMSENVLEEIIQYCQWAAIDSKEYFIEQSCKYILQNSPKWKQFKATLDSSKET
ncbi:MAG: hypothetical protein H0U73_09640 [Tatlockia sp.]|nr:hypothetical protein [Tatlockia sp.]